MDIRLDSPTASPGSSPRSLGYSEGSTHLAASNFPSPLSVSSRATLSPYSDSNRMIRAAVTEKELLQNIDSLIRFTLIPAYVQLKGGNDTIRESQLDTAIFSLKSVGSVNRQIMHSLSQRRVGKQLSRRRSKRSARRSTRNRKR